MTKSMLAFTALCVIALASVPQAEARGISYSGNDVYSLIGRVRLQIFGPLFAAGGYRYEKAKVDEEDVLADIEISGPFLEAGFAF